SASAGAGTLRLALRRALDTAQASTWARVFLIQSQLGGRDAAPGSFPLDASGAAARRVADSLGVAAPALPCADALRAHLGDRLRRIAQRIASSARRAHARPALRLSRYGDDSL